MICKKLNFSFDRNWVLSRRNDDMLPVDAILKEISGHDIEIVRKSPTELGFVVKEEGTAENIRNDILTFIRAQYKLVEIENIVKITENETEIEDKPEEIKTQQPEDTKEKESEQARAEEPEKKEEAEAKSDEAVEDKKGNTEPLSGILSASSLFAKKEEPEEEEGPVIDEIRQLIGAEEFKELAEEIVAIAPKIVKHNAKEIFSSRSYLFAINDGYGLSTYANLFARLVNQLGVFELSQGKPVVEEKIPARSENQDCFRGIKSRIMNFGVKNKVLCIDISEWMTKTHEPEFKEFLSVLEQNSKDIIYIFRVPFVEKDVINNLLVNLEDVLSVKEVSFVPFDNDELTSCAEESIKENGFEIQSDAWEIFDQRISEEKSDGKFYGINTVNKVVREMIYYKLLDNAINDVDDNIIKKNEIIRLVDDFGITTKTAEQLMAELVGMEDIAKRINEVVAQIEMSVKNKDFGNPCIHMRFVGNPGTGKTTVARIIGKLLKERGVLRTGAFFEYSGRDFCGRYVGETAPKTAGMCRDAYGSVLFIDEAYTLYRSDGFSNADYGREAIDTLIAEMENHRSDLVVIMAGYTDEMETLLKSNPGLESRMPYTIEFPNYTREQLCEIFMRMVNKSFLYEDGFEEAVKEYFDNLLEEWINSKDFSNARFVRNLFERTWGKALLRTQLSRDGKTILVKEDFELASNDKEFSHINDKKKSKSLGFSF